MVQRSLHIFSKGALCKGPLQADLEDLVSHKARVCSPYRNECQPTFFGIQVHEGYFFQVRHVAYAGWRNYISSIRYDEPDLRIQVVFDYSAQSNGNAILGSTSSTSFRESL